MFLGIATGGDRVVNHDTKHKESNSLTDQNPMVLTSDGCRPVATCEPDRRTTTRVLRGPARFVRYE